MKKRKNKDKKAVFYSKISQCSSQSTFLLVTTSPFLWDCAWSYECMNFARYEYCTIAVGSVVDVGGHRRERVTPISVISSYSLLRSEQNIILCLFSQGLLVNFIYHLMRPSGRFQYWFSFWNIHSSMYYSCYLSILDILRWQNLTQILKKQDKALAE